MAIRTHQSVSGFVASDPQLTHTERGDARLYLKLGIEHYRREDDNSYTQLETTFHDLIAYRGAAEQGAERLAKGDNIIADGHVREYSYERNGQRYEEELSNPVDGLIRRRSVGGPIGRVVRPVCRW